jgi:hypothetical protein
MFLQRIVRGGFGLLIVALPIIELGQGSPGSLFAAEHGPRAEPGKKEKAWSVVSVCENVLGNTSPGGNTEQIAVAMVRGQPFFYTVTPVDRVWTAVEISQTDKKWRKEILTKNDKKGECLWMDAVAVGDKVYLATNLVVPGYDKIGSLKVRVRADGKWTTEFESKDGGSHYGGRVRLGVVDGRPMAVYTGKYPPSGAYSPNAQFLERTAKGKWTEQALKIPNNGGIFEFDLAARGKEPILFFCTYGGGGEILGQRTHGQWAISNISKRQAVHVHLLTFEGELFAITEDTENARRGTAQVTALKKGEWIVQEKALRKGKLTAVHAASIGGVPTLAWFEARSSTFHLSTYQKGTWSQREVTTDTRVKDVGVLRLFEWNKKPAILAQGATDGKLALLLLTPPGLGGK